VETRRNRGYDTGFPIAPGGKGKGKLAPQSSEGSSMKTWRIIGPDFTAELTIDDRGTVAEADHSLHDLVGMVWDEAREYCIAAGWSGDRYPSHIRGKSGLKRRGWTDRQITQHLPEPDASEANPHHEFGKPMGLYCIRRVECLEQQWGIGSEVPQQQSA
jgi:hypothetical protein